MRYRCTVIYTHLYFNKLICVGSFYGRCVHLEWLSLYWAVKRTLKYSEVNSRCPDQIISCME